MEKVYYQPQWYYDDGTNIEYGDIPDELYSFQVFLTKEDCEEWLIEHDYNPADFVFNTYTADELEDYQIVEM